jgi:hypothetical protein
MSLKVRTWTCSACGAEHDRDVNAALNISVVGFNELATVAFEPIALVNPLAACRRFQVDVPSATAAIIDTITATAFDLSDSAKMAIARIAANAWRNDSFLAYQDHTNSVGVHDLGRRAVQRAAPFPGDGASFH